MLSSQPISYHNSEYNNLSNNGQFCYSGNIGQVATPFSVRDILNLAENCSNDSSTNLFDSTIFQQEDEEETIQTNINNYCSSFDNYCNTSFNDSYTNSLYTCNQEYQQQNCHEDLYYNSSQQYSSINNNNRPSDQWGDITIQHLSSSSSSNQQLIPGMTSQHVQHLSHLTPPFMDNQNSNDASENIHIFYLINININKLG